ncbi:MAG: 4Fe-4S binding protein [Clostridiales bacterium]|nr:4Fe-4S binding protein [Clostridiales bacterium]
MLKKIITKRKIIQFIVGFGVYTAVFKYGINPFYVIAGAIILGSLMGKTFCRWMCPVGFLMEAFNTAMGKDEKTHLYNYHKVGCPIAWIQGYLNKMSFFKIKRDLSTCTSCGLCDKTCYITALNKDFSLYKQLKKDPAIAYKCSKCLDCIAVCPTDSLSLKFEK